jgi:ParB family chromosome partitioning protein
MDRMSRIRLDRIHIGERLRAVDPDHAAHIAASISQIGQQAPIHVGAEGDDDGLFPLIAGAHRVEALRLLGQEVALAIVLDADAADARLIEIDENLMRRELSELDRAVFLAERKALYEARHPEAKAGGLRRKSGADQVRIEAHLPPGAPGFHQDAAKKLGLHPGHVRKLLARARIEPTLRARLVGTRWADHGPALDAIARVGMPAKRARLVDVLTRDGGSERSLADALRIVDGRKAPPAADVQLDRLMAAWRRADAAARRRFEDYLSREREDALTASVRAAARPLPTSEAADA